MLRSSLDLLFGKFGSVLLGDIQTLQLAQLLALNVVDFVLLLFELLADLPALLEVVVALLLFLLLVGINLAANALGVGLQHALLFLINALFLLLRLFLGLNDAEELIALLLGLLSQSALSLEELLLASHFHLSLHLLTPLKLLAFFLTSIPLGLFEGTFGAQSIDFSLSILSLFLEVTETLHFTLLFFLDAALFSHLLFLTLSLGFVVFDDFQFKIFFLLLTTFFNLNGTSVGLFNLNHHNLGSGFFLFARFDLFLL